ncbi:MAG: hypothetical protein HRU41_13860 [Saprospiraceae bacterium]|nr:hypothetical protein [Saprospiraceae bacterium]
MIRGKQMLVFVCAIHLFCSLSSQNLPTADAITIEDGLGFRNVKAIAQDRQGLMWLATQQGLNRFDGYEFTYYNKGPLGDHPLPVEDFAEQGMVIRDSAIWYIANKRLFYLSILTNEVTSVQVSNAENPDHPMDLLQLHLGQLGKLWVVAENSEYQYLMEVIGSNQINSIAKSKRGIRDFTQIGTDTEGNIFWTTIDQGIRQLSPSGHLLWEAKVDSFIWYENRMYFTPFHIDSQDHIFLFPKSKNEIWTLDLVTGEKEIIKEGLDSPVYVTLEDHRGHIWFATKRKLLSLNTDQEWTDYSEEINKPFDFTTINCLFEDQMQLLWVGTDNGIIKLPIKKQAFKNFLSIPKVEWGNTTRGFFENNAGEVFVMCERGVEGLHQLDWQTGEAIAELTAANSRTKDFPFGFSNFFSFDHKRQGVWSANEQLFFLPEQTHALNHIPVNSGLLAGHSPNPILALDNGQLVLGHSLQHLSLFDPDTQSYEKLIPADSPLSSDDQVKFLLEDGETIWIGSKVSGLILVSKAGDILQHYSTTSTPAISHNHILCIEKDQEGTLWIGTFGGGVNRLDPEQQSVNIYTQKDNLANNNVVGILGFDQDYLWISTYNGLSCFHKPTETFQNFYQEDGLSHYEFNYASYFKDSQGRYYFGGMNGVTAFYPQDIIGQAPNPPLQLTHWSQFAQQSKQLEQEDLRFFEKDTLIIKPNVSYFQVNWTLPNYLKPDKNQYYTLLEGLEEDWTYIGNQPSTRYNRLPVGEYILHIKGADSRGNWSSSQLSIPIHVKPYFYHTMWFFVLCMVFITSIIFLIFQYRWQQFLKMERMRLQISSNLHDEVGSMLSGLAMQAEIMEMKAQPEDKAGLQYLSDISRQAVSKMRDLVWSIDTRRSKVKDLVERMQEHAEEMLIPKEISFQFQTSNLPNEKTLQIDTRQQLQLIFREAITNIVKHTDSSQVLIRLQNSNTSFTMSVHDNGSEAIRKWERPSSGLGVENMKMRAEKLNGKLTATPSLEGTIVTLSIPTL